MLIGFSGVILGVFTILYSCFEKSLVSDWYFWAIIASTFFCIGLYFLIHAVLHKIKADLIKKQKMREQHKTFTADNI
jgi:uncharacterized membrane protein YjfL (UPF0719 family)